MNKPAMIAGAACVAACAGAGLLPLVIGGAATGGLLAGFGGEAGLLALFVLALAGGYFWNRRPRAGCECAPDAGCHAGVSCDVPPKVKDQA